MVTVDNVNLDVLELIFSHLAGNDLPSVALVSRAFFAAVIPRLYSVLLFCLSQAKRYPGVMSPFAAIAVHPEFAIHVRHVDIRALPSVKDQFNPKFLIECTRALALCHNLTSFQCSVNAFPPFISVLQKKDCLRDLRINANLTTEQCSKMVGGAAQIRHLTLDFACWNVMDLLPRWAGAIQSSLTTLTIFMANELNETVLESALEQLPNLLGLHVIGCTKVDHVSILSLVHHTPNLTALSMATGDSSRALPTPAASLANLVHLALDMRFQNQAPAFLGGGTSAASVVLTSIFTHIAASSPSLTSFILKYPDRQTPPTIAPTFVQQQLIGAHGRTLKTIALIDCYAEMDVISAICGSCVGLERLEVMIPARDSKLFTAALSNSSTLRLLVDSNALNTQHPRRSGPNLTHDSLKQMFATVASLTKVVGGDRRVWTRRRDVHASDFTVGVEHKPTVHSAAIHWFMPRE
ncbi:hypothetical protein FB45DRAFT_989137 [Roridomyces roridus]|uniref:F-box domain-containing protein n=1 Tax=Roridomyces roridus TaxID=1738132 RepID=A0AAD7FPY9_9AGAR|nr:hypothetical protein FB45DRAFT_989137 [Roridomyces roridus]